MNGTSIPDMCVHFFYRSVSCFLSSSLKVLYLREVGGVGVRGTMFFLERCAHPLLNPVSEGLYLIENVISRGFVTGLLGSQGLQLCTKNAPDLVSRSVMGDQK